MELLREHQDNLRDITERRVVEKVLKKPSF
jgi:hypothetical protein